MGDSDDEYDRKRRDKFRGERAGTGGTEGNSYRGSDRREERSRGREEWQDRLKHSKENVPLGRTTDGKLTNRARSGGRAEYREYRGGGGGAGRYSPARGEGAAAKRARGPDWPDERRYAPAHDNYGAYGWAHDAYGPHAAHHAYPMHAHQPPIRETGIGGAATGETQPAMMTFKAFLAAQDDSITDEDAIKKYNDYKLEFRRQQLNEFFVAHKDEEWFKIRYHPEESMKRKEEQQNSLKNRLQVFLDLLNNTFLDKITVDVDQSDQIIRLLDTVVIKLEGGTDEDLKVLDEQPKPLPIVEKEVKPVEIILDSDENVKKETVDSENEDKKSETEIKAAVEPEDTAPLCMDIDPHHIELQEQAKLFSKVNAPGEETTPAPEITNVKAPSASAKRKRSRTSSNSSSGSSSSSSSSSDSSDSEGDGAGAKSEGEPQPPGHTDDPEEPEKEKEKATEEGEMVGDDKNDKEDEKIEEDKPVEEGEVEKQNDEEGEDTTKVVDIEKKEPRAMHKTTSIFLRNLSPTITKAEVEAMCKRYGGFLRVALADPLPERRWFRRGWVTFHREVNIKEICWNLNNIRLRDCELGAIVNRDLSRRVRPVSGLTLHRQVVRSDARLAARLCHQLDTKAGLWGDNTKGDTQFGLVSSNPVLHNITEYLIEEGSAEEDELLGLTSEGAGPKDAEGVEGGDTVERDPQLTAVLDRLILYLRIVHSMDYYNHCEYPYEDEMPNRCGIMHARGPAPSSKVTANELAEYIRTFESKMSAFLQDIPTIDEQELMKLGTKDCQAEVEKFIQANTQELAKDKWLCPLSGKKFKGPDFIRKHIFNKHAEKVDEVRKEVEYFNNYLRDMKRPQLAEPPQRRPEPAHQPTSYPSSYGSSGYGGYGRGGYGYHTPYYAPPAYAPAPYAPARHGRAFARGRGGVSDFRPVIHYRDLDAPREPEEFI